KERCAFCDALADERDAHTRIFADRDGFVAIAPFASQHPYETWIVPATHAADFGTTADDALPSLAQLLIEVLRALRVALDDPPHPLPPHPGPRDGTDQAAFHWHWEIVPLVGQELGMEWATGIFSTPVPPETAADALRRAAG